MESRLTILEVHLKIGFGEKFISHSNAVLLYRLCIVSSLRVVCGGMVDGDKKNLTNSNLLRQFVQSDPFSTFSYILSFK